MTQLRRRFILGLLLPLCASMSNAAAPVSPPPFPSNIQGWSSSWLVGTTLDLVSDTDILSLRFGEAGWVAMTAGKKGGPVTAPVLPWRIENGQLFVGYSVQPKDGIEFVSFSGNRLVTRSEGKNTIYEVSR